MNPDIDRPESDGENVKSIETARLANQKAPPGIDSTARRKPKRTATGNVENKQPTMGKNRSAGAAGGKKMKPKKYEKRLRKLQAELCMLQDWVKLKGLRVIVVFEGRDGAGKGGTIRAITERVSPRVFRLVALPAPSDREKTQMYMQRYMAHFPAAGEVVIFDRSWYNRAGVEYVMGFCSKEQHRRFLELCPEIEKYMVEAGILLIKFWLEVSDEEQKRRFEARVTDPLRQWKLSPMDLPSRSKWFEYSRARDMMLKATDTKWAPWRILRSDDKKRARLNCITQLLDLIPYKKVPREKIELPKRSMKQAYDDSASLKGRKFVPEKY
jgi:polyphosphate kinase 2